MPNRRQSGYMPHYEKGMDVKRNTSRAEEARDRGNERGRDVSPVGRPDLVDAGDFGRQYEEWSLGDLENRARQLGVEADGPLTKERLIEAIRAKES